MKNKKWKIYLYLNNQCIKKVKRDEDFDLKSEVFIVNVFNKKHLLGTRIAKVVCLFSHIKYYDETNKIAHIEVNLYKGKEVE